MKTLKLLLAAAACTTFAVPAMAQEEEEPRTTYAVTTLEFADGADQNRWLEIMDTMINPAREAAGMEPETIHWVMMNDDFDIILIGNMPGGMANFDSHAPADRMAFIAALRDLAGGEEGLGAMFEEMDGLIEESHTVYTHTHP